MATVAEELNDAVSISQFWKEFFSQTNDLKDSKVFESPASIAVGIDDVVTVINSISKNHAPGLNTGLRLYIDNVQRPDYEQTVIHNPPSYGASLEEWANTLFNNQRFGLIINQSERWNDDLCIKISKFLAPLRQKYGLIRDLVEIVIFIGNYGYTPFGIHYDGDCLSNIHLHLGPGQKSMYLWEPEIYKKLTGSYEFCHNPESVINTGQEFIIPAKSVYYLPAGYYHVGCTKDFSVGIAISFARNTNKDFMLSAIKTRLENDFSKIPEYMLDKELNEANSNLVIQPLLEQMFQHEMSVNRFFQTAIDEQILSIKSNNGFKTSPIKKNIDVDLTSRLIKIPNFEISISSLEDDKRLLVYVRGNRIIIKKNQSIMQLIARLNHGEEINLSSFAQDNKQNLSESDLISFVKILVCYSGVYIQ